MLRPTPCQFDCGSDDADAPPYAPDVEVTSLPRVRQYVPRADSLDGELDALVAELQTEYRRAS